MKITENPNSEIARTVKEGLKQKTATVRAELKKLQTQNVCAKNSETR